MGVKCCGAEGCSGRAPTGGVVDRPREVVEIRMPEHFVGKHSTDEFNDVVAAALYKGAEVKLLESVNPQVAGQDYLMFVQPSMRAAVLRDLGAWPDVFRLKNYAMSVLAGPMSLRNYSYVMDKNTNSISMNYDEGSETAWTILMRVKGVKIGSEEEKRLLRGAVLRPLMESADFLSFGNEVVMASKEAALRKPLVKTYAARDCNCLASRLCELVGKLPVTGAKSLRDVVVSIDFLQACMHNEVADRAVRLAVRHGVLVCYDMDYVGSGTVVTSISGMGAMSSELLELPLWCDLCDVLDTTVAADVVGVTCGGCGGHDRVIPQIEHTYDDLVSDPGLHFAIEDRVASGKALFERDKFMLSALLMGDDVGVDARTGLEEVLPHVTHAMTDLGKKRYCTVTLRAPDRVGRDVGAWAHRFDYAYTGVFRARYLCDILIAAGARGWRVHAELLCISHVRRLCGNCGVSSDVGINSMIDSLLDCVMLGKSALLFSAHEAHLWSEWCADHASVMLDPVHVPAIHVANVYRKHGMRTGVGTHIYRSSVSHVGGVGVACTRASLPLMVKAKKKKRGRHRSFSSYNVLAPVKVHYDKNAGLSDTRCDEPFSLASCLCEQLREPDGVSTASVVGMDAVRRLWGVAK